MGQPDVFRALAGTQPLDDFGASPLGTVSPEDLPADRLVRRTSSPLNGERGASWASRIRLFRVLEEIRVAGGELQRLSL
jgi:hypothetical protein